MPLLLAIEFPYKCDFREPRELTSMREGFAPDTKTDPQLDPEWEKLRIAPPPVHH